jgi:DNA polymerase elongation subunit (family B)
MICGLHISDDARVHLCIHTEDGGRRELVEDGFRPFLWAKNVPVAEGMEAVALEGSGPFRHLLLFDSVAVYTEAARDRSLETENQRPLEAQYLMQSRRRLFEGMTFVDLRRCQLKIEVDSESEAPDPMNKDDRIAAIALLKPDGQPVVLTPEDGDERAMLKRFGELLREIDPDVIEGHGIFGFDLDFLIRRCRRLRLNPAWGRFGADASHRRARLRVAERWIDYTRVDIPGRAIFDTLLAIQLFDITGRELQGYELEDVALHFGIDFDADAEGDRPKVTGEEAGASSAAASGGSSTSDYGLSIITSALRAVRAVASLLLPTYYAQALNFPIPLQDLALRGTGGKVDSLLLEHYYHARRALPDFVEVATYEGAFTRCFETGVFHKVLHYEWRRSTRRC